MKNWQNQLESIDGPASMLLVHENLISSGLPMAVAWFTVWVWITGGDRSNMTMLEEANCDARL